MKPKKNQYEVIVMGGGPAGSAVATLLAKQGRDVLILEKDRFPRYHIGESLIPETYWPLLKMGVLDKIKEAGFTKKFSVQFANAKGRASRPFYFFETNHHESAVTWQVTRDKFDKILLDHARESGVEAVEGARVTEVFFEGERAVGVEAELTVKNRSSNERHKLLAKVIVDATGMSCFLVSKLGMRVRDPKLKKASIYGYFRNALREPGVDEGATLILKTKEGNGWFWFLPLADDITSVGVVADPRYLFRDRGRHMEKILREEIERCVAVKRLLPEAERVGQIYTINDFSYRARHWAGPGYVLIGDAFGFLDPVYSSGVFLALKSGELAAESIADAFEHNDFSAQRLGAFGAKLSKGMESFRKLVYAFYSDGFSMGSFMREHPQFRRHLIDILIGDVMKDGVDEIFGPMSRFAEIPESLVSDTGGGGRVGDAEPLGSANR